MARRSLKKLPRSGAVWEVGMIHREYARDGVAVTGLLVVVERDGGLIRIATAVLQGESPAVAFREAIVAPQSPARPGLPRHVVFDDPWLRDQMTGVLGEAGILSVSTETTLALDDAVARLLLGAGAPVAPGIDADLRSWREAIQDLIRVAPWTALDDSVVFSFAGGGLDAASASVTGHGGELLGVVLHEERDDAERWRSARGTSAPHLHAAVHLILEPRSGLSAMEIERCLRVALQFPPGLYPRVYAVSRSGIGVATPEQQTVLLAVVRAVTALCRQHLADLGAGGVRSLQVDGVTVTARSVGAR